MHCNKGGSLKKNLKSEIRLLFFAVCLTVISLKAQPPASDKILFNGTVYTMDTALSISSAVAIRGSKIVAVGRLSDVRRHVSNDAQMIDMEGKWLLPGLIDSHIHAIKGGVRLLTADANDRLMSGDQLRSFATEALESGRGVRGDALYITGIHSAQWLAVGILDSLFNEAPFNEKPVLLLGTDGHTAWANRILLTSANIDRDVIDALPIEERVFYGVDKAGRPNGLLSEEAIQQVSHALPPSPVTFYQGALRAVEHLNSLGITGWLDPSAGSIEDTLHNEYLTAYAQLEKDRQLTAHVATTVIADASAATTAQIRILKSLQHKFQSNHVSVLGFKIFADGVLEFPTQTAALSIPYLNSGKSGSLMVDPQHLASFVTRADSTGLLVHIHAIGDRAVTISLDAFATARTRNHNDTIPHGITHLQLVLPDDFGRFAALNVLPSMQLLWATADRYTIDLVKPYIAPSLFDHQYPAMSLVRAGATLCGASDWPVSSANPFAAISVAESRKGGLGILDASEAVPRIEMLKAYTRHGARSLMMEKSIGSIEPGKQADLVLVDRNVLSVDTDSLKDTRVIWTIFAGNFVYR